MRHLFLIIAGVCLLSLTNAYAHNSSLSSEDQKTETRSEKHLEREKAREERTAQMVAHIDSLIISSNYSFIPLTYNIQPAGTPRNVINPQFRMDVYDEFIDIYLPFIRGIAPPFINTIINCTIPLTSLYKAETTKDGWAISFSSSLFSENNYTFNLEVFTSSGEATLNLSSDLYNTVTYNGTINAVSY